MKPGSVVRLVAIALAIGLFFLPAADARKKRKPPKPQRVERTATAEYQVPSSADFAGNETWRQCALVIQMCFEFPVESGEAYVSLRISDMTGKEVPGVVRLSDFGDPSATSFNFCGVTEEPIALAGATEITVFPGAVNFPDCGQAVGTSGTIEVVFSNIPELGVRGQPH